MPYASNDGLRIHYHLDGNLDGLPLVLQHGFGMTLHSWYEPGYAAALGASHRLILVDARGHGRSDKPHDPVAYSAARMASDVVAVLDDLGLARAIFCGHSMGGKIGFGLAMHASDRLQALIIGGDGAQERDAEAPGRRAMRELLTQGPEVWVSAIAAVFGPWATPDMLARQRENDPAALSAFQSVTERPDYAEAVRHTTVPTLIYCGDDDPEHRPAQALADAMPSARFVTLPGIAHVASFYRTDLVLPELARFLDEVSPREMTWRS